MYQKAYELVCQSFQNKYDKAGEKYIYHLLGVSSQGKNEYEKTLGLLHDIIEDTKITKEDLINYQFPLDLVNRVVALTKLKTESYNEYINRLLKTNDLIVLHIKKYDLLNNLDKERQAKLPLEEITYFNNKYLPVLKKINHKIQELENN